VDEGLWGAGGYFYIGKNIPWLVSDFERDHGFQAAMRDPPFNRVITYDEREPEVLQQKYGFRIADWDGRAITLAR
jgi:hypothetical protein